MSSTPPDPLVLSAGPWLYVPLVPENTNVTAEPLEVVNLCPLRSSWPFSTTRTADWPGGVLVLIVTSAVSIWSLHRKLLPADKDNVPYNWFVAATEYELPCFDSCGYPLVPAGQLLELTGGILLFR